MMQVAQRKTQSASRVARLQFGLQMAQQAKKVGAAISELRAQRGWSRPELARRLPGVSTGNDVYRWEQGKHLPRPDTLDAIAAVFEVPLADLYAGPTDGSSPSAPDPFSPPEDDQLKEIERKIDLLLAHFQINPLDLAAAQAEALAPDEPARSTEPSEAATPERQRTPEGS